MANKNSKKKHTNNKKNNNKKVETLNKNYEVKNKKEKEFEKTSHKEEIKVEKIEKEETVKKVDEVKIKNTKKKFELTSKQKDLILVLLVVVLLVMALVLTGEKKEKLNIELPIALTGEAGFTEITYSEYEEKLNTEAPFVVVIVRDGCSFCDDYKPVVSEVADEYNLPIYFINLSNLTSEENSALSSSNSYLKKEQWGTPTTLFMYGDTVVDSIGGFVEKEQFVDFAKENFVVDANE